VESGHLISPLGPINRKEFCHDRTAPKNARRTAVTKYSPATIEAYLRSVANFARHFSAPPDRLGPQHIRQYQLYLVQRKKVSWSVFNQTVCALRFFYHHILHRDWMIEHIPYPRHEQKLPVVLSPTEVAAVFDATRNLKHRAMLLMTNVAGLRGSELANLRVADIDGTREVICVRQSKGHKDRQVMLSPKLLELLRIYGKSYRPRRWLFAGRMRVAAEVSRPAACSPRDKADSVRLGRVAG
jgi:integrase/recombinase XerD